MGEQANRMWFATRERLIIAQVVNAPIAVRGNDDRQIARLEPGVIGILPDGNVSAAQAVGKVEVGQTLAPPLEVRQLDADYAGHRRGEARRDAPAVKVTP